MYYVMPKVFMKQDISNNAKLLLMVLFNNGGCNLQELTRKEVAEILNVNKSTVCKLFKELSDADLIVDERQGLQKPNLIRVKKENLKP